MTWADNDFMLEHAREALAERFPGQVVEIIECFDIAWCGWEFDHEGALISVDGVPRLVVINQTGSDDGLEQQIIERMPEYRRLLDDTARVLSTLWYRRASRGDRRDLPSYEDRVMTEVYRRVGYVEHMGYRGCRHVLEALRTASNQAANFPEEIEHSKKLFDDVARGAFPADSEIPVELQWNSTDDWTSEDERLAVHSQIANIIDTMPIEHLERVLTAVKGIRDEPDNET